MPARVFPFVVPPRRLIADPNQRAVFELFMSELQILMLERPMAFKHLVRQTHRLAAPLRKKLTDIC